MTVSWSARRYHPMDDEQLFELVRTHLKAGRTREEWAWSFKGNPVETPVGVAVDDASGAVLGQYGVSAIPVSCNIGRVEIKAAVSVDTLIHPSIRRQGAFVHLGEQVCRELEDSGYKFVIAVPGEHRNSKPGLLKLGFQPICKLLRVTGDIAAIRPTSRLRLPAPEYSITPWKPHIHWRFASRPNAHYWITACDRRTGDLQVVRIEKDHVVLVYSSLTDLGAIYDGLRAVAAVYGRKKMAVYGKEEDPLIEHLGHTCAMETEDSGYTFMVKPLGVASERLLDPRSWHPMGGWFDVF